MVRTLDLFSQFLVPEMNREMKTETEGQFGGVGLRLRTFIEEWLTVLTADAWLSRTTASASCLTTASRRSTAFQAKDMDMDQALKLGAARPAPR